MILTRSAILAAVRRGDIVIDPFEPERVSPNAYDWRLGDRIRVCDGDLDAAVSSQLPEFSVPPEGMVLLPGRLYLGVTHERTCSTTPSAGSASGSTSPRRWATWDTRSAGRWRSGWPVPPACIRA
jgi:hypothetical protein